MVSGVITRSVMQHIMHNGYFITEVCTLGLSSSMHAVLVILFKYTINSYKVRLDLYFSA